MQNIYKAISHSLSGRMLGHALTLLHPWVKELGGTYVDRWTVIRTNYQYVADYYLSGNDDAQRVEVIDGLVRDAYGLLDDAYRQKRLNDSTSYEFSEMLRDETADNSTPERTFRHYWLRPVGEEGLNQLLQLSGNPEMLDEALMGISGVTLRLLRTFQQDELLCLINLCGEQYEEPIRERAWVGALWVLMTYDERLPFFPEVVEALQDLITTDDGMVFARTALTCVLRTLGTEKAGEAYKDYEAAIMPLINKVMRDGKDWGNQILTQDKIDAFAEDAASEFKDVINDKRDALKRIANSRLDTRFAMFKGMYQSSFFSEPAHWWLPYAVDYLPEDCRKAKNIFGLSKHMEMCDSDRFALVTNLASIGMINNTPVEDLPDMPDMEDLPETEHLLCNDYVQQCYRFFMLNPWQVANPLDKVAAIHKSHLLLLLCPTAAEKQLTADTLLECGAYEQAAAIYKMVSNVIDSAELWRSLGYAAICEGDYDNALYAMQKAYAMEPTEWTCRQLVVIYRSLGRYADEMKQLDALLQTNPENEAYQYERGKCLERMELYQEALQQYYRLELYHPESARIYSAIAWCSFLCDDYATAERYFAKLDAQGKQKSNDLLNKGHLLFVQGKRLEALEVYKRCLAQMPTLKDFLRSFRPDRSILLEKGVPKNEIYLMEDQLVLIYASLSNT